MRTTLWMSARRSRLWISAALICALIPAALDAQPGESNMGEVAAFGGGSFGPGARPVVGASTGMAFSKHGLALVEIAFTPLGDDTLRHRTGAPVESSRLYDFNTSFHIRFPMRERWAPYGIVGGGLLFNSFRAISGSGGLTVAVDEFNFGFHTGAGVRYYVRPDWGIRPELKVVVSNRTYARLTVGIFYNLPPGWPW